MKFNFKLIILTTLLIFITSIINATLPLRPEEAKAITEANQNLIKNLNVKISSYGDKDKIVYGQIYENKDREGDTSLLILLHDEYREFKYRKGLDYLNNPLIKPFLEYIKNNHKKVIILIPESNYFSDWLGYTNLNTPENKLHISITKQLQILYKVGEYKNPIVEPPIQKVIELAQITINKYKIPLNKVYIAGISMGGIGCYYMLANYPDYFNKALIFGSDLPNEYIEKIKGKLFVVQGENDGPSKYQTIKDKLLAKD